MPAGAGFIVASATSRAMPRLSGYERGDVRTMRARAFGWNAARCPSASTQTGSRPVPTLEDGLLTGRISHRTRPERRDRAAARSNRRPRADHREGPERPSRKTRRHAGVPMHLDSRPHRNGDGDRLPRRRMVVCPVRFEGLGLTPLRRLRTPPRRWLRPTSPPHREFLGRHPISSHHDDDDGLVAQLRPRARSATDRTVLG